jgi:hypothetical protein
LWHDGRVPEWIDLTAIDEDGQATVLEARFSRWLCSYINIKSHGPYWARRIHDRAARPPTSAPPRWRRDAARTAIARDDPGSRHPLRRRPGSDGRGPGARDHVPVPHLGLDIYTDSWLRGDWDVFGEPVDFLFDLQSSISSAAHSATTDALNDVRVRDIYRQTFAGLARRYIQDVNHEVLDILGNIQAVDGGLKARYWVQ